MGAPDSAGEDYDASRLYIPVGWGERLDLDIVFGYSFCAPSHKIYYRNNTETIRTGRTICRMNDSGKIKLLGFGIIWL